MTAARGPDFGPSAWLPVPGRLPDGLEAISARLAEFAVAPRLVDRLRSLREGAAERKPLETPSRSFLAPCFERGKLDAVRLGQMFILAHVMRGRRRPGRRVHAQHLGHSVRDAHTC